MNRKRVLTFGALALIGLVVAAYLLYIYLPGWMGDRPTMMYFRADL
jgi:hypothetical protein